MTDPYAHLAQRFVAHYDTLRGAVRHQLVGRQLRAHLPPPPARVADVGGGAGHRALELAHAGYDVWVLDPSAEMLERARTQLAAADPAVASRVRLVEGVGEDGPRLLGADSFDAVLCHGVLMYLDDPAPLVRALIAVARPGAVTSILAKNGDALAVRLALLGRWRDALAAFDADRDVGGLGVTTRADTLTGLTNVLATNGVEVTDWYGVRVFTDHLLHDPPGEDLADIVEVEWEAGRRDPYRALGRLLHIVGRATAADPRRGSA